MNLSIPFSATTPSDTVAPELEKPDTLRVLIAFDDQPAYRRALRLLVRVLSRAGDGLHVRPMPWSFDSFGVPDSRALAALDAAHADIMVISASKGGAPSAEVQTWVETCCAVKPNRDRLLVALLGTPGEAREPHRTFLDFLRNVATQAGLAFLTSGTADVHGAARSRDSVPAFVS